MGYGDDLIVSGEARKAQEKEHRPVLVFDSKGRVCWSEVWAHNPRFLHPGSSGGVSFQRLRDGPGAAPLCCGRGVEQVDLAALSMRARGDSRFVVIEPNVKPISHRNKDWGWAKWQSLATQNFGVRLVQVGPPGMRTLPGVVLVATTTFREACAVLKRSAGYCGHEGGLHHASAAVGRPAVVIFGGFIGPEHTGYKTHRNLAVGPACGNRTNCPHCRRAMDAIDVETVASNLREILQCPSSATPAP